MIKYVALILSLLWNTQVMAVGEENSEMDSYTIEELTSQIPNFTTTPENGVDWKIFSKTKEIPYKIMRDEIEWEGIKPEFPEELKKLNGKTVKMSGYMFPLDQTEDQKQFLFGPFPLSCPYHYHSPNSLTIEAHADKPLPFSYDQITIKGTLELVPEDYEYNTFYRLKNVTVSN